MITINTNVNNLKLQRNLNSVNSTMQNALSRISTGYKINNASDDAAGLVISKALETQTRGLDVANNNAQMATNLLNTADGALNQMSELTMRIRDLATQSSNGVYSNTERKALDLEAKELTNNLEQLIKGTKFNEYNIFEGNGSATVVNKITEEQAIAQGYEVIKTAQELKTALTSPDALNNTNKKVMLFNDINLDDLGIVNGNNWTAVGTYSNPFNGTFDGNGYTISNLKINKPTNDYQGFFGYANGATIKNTSLENVDVKGKSYTGGLAGYLNSSTIQNSYSTGNVTGANYTGGLAGELYSSTIQNSYSAGNVAGSNYTGGLAGYLSSSTIQNSYSTGNVAGANYTGGLAGLAYANSKIINSYATSDVTSNGYAAGGFIGHIGGNPNTQTTTIENSYSTGDVYGADQTGGFAGFVGNCAGQTNIIKNCYSTGQNYSTGTDKGGFAGLIYADTILKLNNYAFATQTSAGVNNTNGIGTIQTGAIIDPTTVFTTSGQTLDWFSQTSNISSIIGAGSSAWDYTTLPPKLKWQIPPTPPTGNGTLTFQIGTDASNLSAISINLAFTLGNFKPDFTNAETSRTTMQQCDNLLKQINTKRGEIGANTNIISSIIDSNTITNENLTASKSRIKDADIARESASIVKNQILESATSSLLSQSSNINGQLALQLLSGLGGR